MPSLEVVRKEQDDDVEAFGVRDDRPRLNDHPVLLWGALACNSPKQRGASVVDRLK